MSPPRRAMVGLLALLLTGFLVAAEETRTEPEAAVTAEEAEAAQKAEALGRLMFQHDRAAWIATDIVQKLKQFRKEKRLRGYVTVPVADSIRVIFFGDGAAAGSHAALYQVDIGPDFKPLGGPEVFTEPKALDSFESAGIAARELVMRQQYTLCSKSYNTIVLPTGGSSDQTWTVYLLPAQTEAGFQIGGAYRLEVNAAGDQILSRRGFTKSCIELPNDRKAVSLVLTHLMDPVPTELHVFTSLAAGKPLYVLAIPSNTIWAVEGARIRLVERNKADTP